ncbi:hypothetical protein ABH922_001083 [Rhodococcus sp. 27YEA15]|uniref:WXG100 family type VII secretion target n=1 Tax=Rhodococcus sp. 27YEA15 TaxID=3156259 RepID=UPI003C7BEF4F
MSENLGVDPQVLVDAAAGINSIVDTLSDLGIGETGSVGRGFANLALSTLEAGHHGVQQNFEEFTERWTWGVRALVQAANSIAEALDLAAGLYHSVEQTNSTMLKTVWTNIAGDPRLSSEDIGSRSWGETFADNQYNSTLNADYSSESFSDAWSTITTNAESIGRDSVTIATPGAR